MSNSLITMSDIKMLYEKNVLPIPALLYFCVKEQNSVNPQEICRELGIDKGQFYHAVSSLRREGLDLPEINDQPAKITLREAINRYEAGFLTVMGLLAFYFEITEIEKVNPDEICRELGISKASFYKAMDKLRKRGQAPQKIKVVKR